jgi:hypothetical protein
VELSTYTEFTALLTARRVVNAKLWELYHTKRPKNERKLLNVTAPLHAELQGNTVALRAAIVDRIWREHPDWRRPRVADQRQVMDLAERLYAELVSTVDGPDSNSSSSTYPV